MTSLVSLNLTWNRISELPPEIGRLASLQVRRLARRTRGARARKVNCGRRFLFGARARACQENCGRFPFACACVCLCVCVRVRVCVPGRLALARKRRAWLARADAAFERRACAMIEAASRCARRSRAVSSRDDAKGPPPVQRCATRDDASPARMVGLSVDVWLVGSIRLPQPPDEAAAHARAARLEFAAGAPRRREHGACSMPNGGYSTGIKTAQL